MSCFQGSINLEKLFRENKTSPLLKTQKKTIQLPLSKSHRDSSIPPKNILPFAICQTIALQKGAKKFGELAKIV